jgi:hypothetical protein
VILSALADADLNSNPGANQKTVPAFLLICNNNSAEKIATE